MRNSLLVVTLIGVGILLIYSAITGKTPKDVILSAFGKEGKNGS